MKLLRNYIIVLAIVAVIAVALAALSVMGYLTKADQAVLYPGDLLTVNMSEPGIDDLATILDTALRNAEPLETPPVIPATATTVPLQTRTEGGVLVGAYSLHVISMIDRNAILEDEQTGTYSRLSIRDFSTLFSHAAFSDLPEKRFTEPSVTLEFSSGTAPQTLWANSGTLYYYTAEGTYRKIEKKEETSPVAVSLTTEQAAQAPSLSMSGSPDAWSLNVVSDETTYLSQNRVDQKELYFPTNPGNYTYTLTAHWELSPQRDWYGEITYVLEINITEPEAPDPVPEDPEGESSDS